MGKKSPKGSIKGGKLKGSAKVLDDLVRNLKEAKKFSKAKKEQQNALYTNLVNDLNKQFKAIDENPATKKSQLFYHLLWGQMAKQLGDSKFKTSNEVIETIPQNVNRQIHYHDVKKLNPTEFQLLTLLKEMNKVLMRVTEQDSEAKVIQDNITKLNEKLEKSHDEKTIKDINHHILDNQARLKTLKKDQEDLAKQMVAIEGFINTVAGTKAEKEASSLVKHLNERITFQSDNLLVIEVAQNKLDDAFHQRENEIKIEKELNEIKLKSDDTKVKRNVLREQNLEKRIDDLEKEIQMNKSNIADLNKQLNFTQAIEQRYESYSSIVENNQKQGQLLQEKATQLQQIKATYNDNIVSVRRQLQEAEEKLFALNDKVNGVEQVAKRAITLDQLSPVKEDLKNLEAELEEQFRIVNELRARVTDPSIQAQLSAIITAIPEDNTLENLDQVNKEMDTEYVAKDDNVEEFDASIMDLVYRRPQSDPSNSASSTIVKGKFSQEIEMEKIESDNLKRTQNLKSLGPQKEMLAKMENPHQWNYTGDKLKLLHSRFTNNDNLKQELTPLINEYAEALDRLHELQTNNVETIEGIKKDANGLHYAFDLRRNNFESRTVYNNVEALQNYKQEIEAKYVKPIEEVTQIINETNADIDEASLLLKKLDALGKQINHKIHENPIQSTGVPEDQRPEIQIERFSQQAINHHKDIFTDIKDVTQVMNRQNQELVQKKDLHLAQIATKAEKIAEDEISKKQTILKTKVDNLEQQKSQQQETLKKLNAELGQLSKADEVQEKITEMKEMEHDINSFKESKRSFVSEVTELASSVNEEQNQLKDALVGVDALAQRLQKGFTSLSSQIDKKGRAIFREIEREKRQANVAEKAQTVATSTETVAPEVIKANVDAPANKDPSKGTGELAKKQEILSTHTKILTNLLMDQNQKLAKNPNAKLEREKISELANKLMAIDSNNRLANTDVDANLSAMQKIVEETSQLINRANANTPKPPADKNTNNLFKSSSTAKHSGNVRVADKVEADIEQRERSGLKK